jgi:hemoglobin
MEHGNPAIATPFERLGGEQAVRTLVDRFYDLMDESPRYARLRATHGGSLSLSRDKLFWFLCGWLGGPQHYVERFGDPMLRARHLRVSIGAAERDEWLSCMNEALRTANVDRELHEQLLGALTPLADWMRNRPGEEPSAGAPGLPIASRLSVTPSHDAGPTDS